MGNLYKLNSFRPQTFCSKSAVVFRESPSSDQWEAPQSGMQMLQQLMMQQSAYTQMSQTVDAQRAQREAAEARAHQTQMEGIDEAAAIMTSWLQQEQGDQVRALLQ